MGYVKVFWPDSQMFMELTDEEMDEFDIEGGPDCSYFVPEDVYEEAYPTQACIYWNTIGKWKLKHMKH